MWEAGCPTVHKKAIKPKQNKAKERTTMISKGYMRKAKKRTEVALGNVADSDYSLDEETTTNQSKKQKRDINTDEESEKDNS